MAHPGGTGALGTRGRFGAGWSEQRAALRGQARRAAPGAAAGPGEGRTGLRRAERCLLHFALQPRQLQPDAERAERPQPLAELAAAPSPFPLETTRYHHARLTRTLGLQAPAAKQDA